MKIFSLKKGEEVVEALTAKVQPVSPGASQGGDEKSGIILGLGALSWAKLMLYDLEKKEYSSKKINGPLEVASFTAMVAKNPNGKIGIHPHIVVANKDFQAFGGHLKEGEVAATFEVIFFNSTKEIKRYYNKDIGLNLLER